MNPLSRRPPEQSLGQHLPFLPTPVWSLGGVTAALLALGALPGGLPGQDRPWDRHDPRLFSSGLYRELQPVPETTPQRRAKLADAAAVRLEERVGENQRLGDDPAPLPAGNRSQAEPHVAVSPADPNVLLATFQEGRLTNGGASGNGYALSRDGGLTWRRALIPRLTRLDGGPYWRATDPVAAIDHLGRMYLNSLVATASDFSSSQVVLNVSADGGDTWSAPRVITASEWNSANDTFLPDKNWMAVDTWADSPHRGRVVVTWTRFRTLVDSRYYNYNDATIWASVSDDAGLTWSPAAEVSTPPPLGGPGRPYVRHELQWQGSQPLYLPGGQLAVVYHYLGDAAQATNPERLDLALSLDGGRTFLPTRQAITPVARHWDEYARNGGFLPSAAADRTAGHVYVAYQGLVGSGRRILFTRSLDRTTHASGPAWTWSAPIPVDDEPTVPKFNPTLSVSDDGQTVAVMFYDKRQDPARQYWVDLYLALSHDGGVTWQPNVRLTSASSDMRLSVLTDRGYMLGDYLGLVGPEGPHGSVVPLWIDTRDGGADPYAVRVGASPDPFWAWLAARAPRAWMEQPAYRQANGDPDGDGLVTLAEYLQEGDPLAADNDASLDLPLDPGQNLGWGTSFPRPADDRGLQYSWEGSWNGIDFFPLAPATFSVQESFGLDRRRVSARFANEPPPAHFFRQVVRHPAEGPDALVHWPRSAYPLDPQYDLGAGWVWSVWMGFVYHREYPFLHLPSLGWVYHGAGLGDNLWLWHPGDGWFWTTASHWPWRYVWSEAAWRQL